MSRDKLNYVHGDSGTKPGNSLDFQKNQRPQAGNFDWFWYNVIESLRGHAEEFDRLDSDDDGVVDAADGASTYSSDGTPVIENPTEVNFSGDINVSDDGGGTVSISAVGYTDSDARSAVDGADVDIAGDADTVDGQHASAFASAGHVHDGRYIEESGDTLSGTLDFDGNAAVGVSDIDGVNGNHRISFDGNSDYIEVEYQNGTSGKLKAADLYVGAGIGWLSNAINEGGARSAVDGSNVDINGKATNATKWGGYEIQVDGTDGSGIINFKTS